MTAGPLTRFKRAHPCPICGGGDDMHRGRGQRCSGYLSSDGRFAYCTREEHAGFAALEDTDPPSYRHILEGDCRCGATHNPARQSDDLVATYDYQDTDGTLLYQVVRLAGKQFRQRQPDGSGDWVWNMQGVTRVLYRLPQVLAAAAAGETVYIAEGEKDVHAIEKAGAVATTSPGGAGKWRSEYASVLQGATVIIVADNDEPGLKHAHEVAQTLPGATTRIVKPAVGKDAHDHLAAGKTLAELVPLEQAAEPDQPAPVIFETLRNFLKRALPKSESLVGTARDGTNLLPRYGWVMPWGREGSGKTSVLVDLIFHAATGRDWLRYPIARPMKIVCVINEGVPGGLQDKLDQKVERWQGDTDQVLDNIALYVSPWGEFTFKNDAVAKHARDYALDFQADYVVFDPLHTLGTSGSGTPEETETFKHILRNFGLWNDLGVITAHHSNKNGMVSGDWARHPDTVIRLEKDGKNPATKFTLEKARPAAPNELGVPVLLEWETEDLGYRLVDLDTRSKTSDDEILAGIYKTLEEADKPLGITKLRLAVTGDDTRIGEIVNAEIKAGRITDSSTRTGYYLLSVANGDTDSTDSAREYEQTSITTQDEVCETRAQIPTDSDIPPDTALESVSSPAPVRGEQTQTPATGHDLDLAPYDDDELERLRSLTKTAPAPEDQFGDDGDEMAKG